MPQPAGQEGGDDTDVVADVEFDVADAHVDDDDEGVSVNLDSVCEATKEAN